jgi:hypothetical protein
MAEIKRSFPMFLRAVWLLQNVHKKLHTCSDTRNKCGVRRPSHLNQSKEKLSKVCFKRTASYLLWPLALNSIRFENGYPATKKFIFPEFDKDRNSSSHETCI